MSKVLISVVAVQRMQWPGQIMRRNVLAAFSAPKSVTSINTGTLHLRRNWFVREKNRKLGNEESALPEEESKIQGRFVKIDKTEILVNLLRLKFEWPIDDDGIRIVHRASWFAKWRKARKINSHARDGLFIISAVFASWQTIYTFSIPPAFCTLFKYRSHLPPRVVLDPRGWPSSFQLFQSLM